MNDLSKWGTNPNRSWAKFNSFLSDVSIFYPLKISENLWSSGVFREYKNENISQIWVEEVDRNNSNLLMLVNGIQE